MAWKSEETNDPKTVEAAWVKRRRVELGITQQQLATMVGITNVSISNIEHGKFRMKSETAQKVAQAFVAAKRGGAQRLASGRIERLGPNL